jgi:ketosteroid isomerase-like protein
MNEWDAEEAAIRQMFVEMNQCFLRADFGARSNFLTADSLTLPQDAPDLLDREQITVSFERVISKARQKTGVTLRDFPVDELIVFGNLAYVRVTYITSILERNLGEWSDFFASRHFYIVRKEADGEWRIMRDMWSNILLNESGP